jgi:hypothetical protein
MLDSAGGTTANPRGFVVPAGPVSAIGRYIKRHFFESVSITREEADRLSDAGLQIFTIWESQREGGGGDDGEPHWRGEPAWPDTWPKLDPDKSFKLGSDYFDPRRHTGSDDGQEAFAFAGTELRQPPHTPIFFAIDGDADWDKVPPRFFDPLPAGTTTGTWIEHYFRLIYDERSAWEAQHPDRPYLIGVYGSGRVLRELYKLGIVDAFWQAMSTGWDESRPADNLWPWPHANRWQYQGDETFCGIKGVDPDADWGDGGTWTLADPLARALIRQESLLHTLFPAPIDVLIDLEP